MDGADYGWYYGDCDGDGGNTVNYIGSVCAEANEVCDKITNIDEDSYLFDENDLRCWCFSTYGQQFVNGFDNAFKNSNCGKDRKDILHHCDPEITYDVDITVENVPLNINLNDQLVASYTT